MDSLCDWYLSPERQLTARVRHAIPPLARMEMAENVDTVPSDTYDASLTRDAPKDGMATDASGPGSYPPAEPEGPVTRNHEPIDLLDMRQIAGILRVGVRRAREFVIRYLDHIPGAIVPSGARKLVHRWALNYALEQRSKQAAISRSLRKQRPNPFQSPQGKSGSRYRHISKKPE